MTNYIYGNKENTQIVEVVDGVNKRFIPLARFNSMFEDGETPANIEPWVDPNRLTDEQKIDALWKACRAYQDTQITDDISALYYVEKASPKAQACLDWKDSLWQDYYTRKSILSEDLDFSNNGQIPFSYPEVRAEVEGA